MKKHGPHPYLWPKFTRMHKIAILASGSGSNAEAIFNHFLGHKSIKVEVVISNNASAGVHDRAKKHHINSVTINTEQTKKGLLLKCLKENQINFIVLAGYMKLIPIDIINAFEGRIVNIHPALLPKFGGKGMYGMNVHKAVVEAGESRSGMTIHYVDAKYDEGNIIYQDSIAINEKDTAEDVQKKVLALEHKHYPRVIEETILNKV